MGRLDKRGIALWLLVVVLIGLVAGGALIMWVTKSDCDHARPCIVPPDCTEYDCGVPEGVYDSDGTKQLCEKERATILSYEGWRCEECRRAVHGEDCSALL